MEERPILTFTNPATGATFGQVEMTDPEEVRQALETLRGAARVWREKTVAERGRILRQFQGVLLDALDEISDVINQDCGKSRQDALIEVFMTIDMLAAYLKHAPRWLRRQHLPTGLYLFKRAYMEHKPYGVVGVIAPWNYPFALSMPPVLAALLAGNTVMLKPSEVTAATGVLMEKLFRRVPELAPFVRVIHGDGRVGAAMVQAGPDYIFLTGSPATGVKVLQAAAEKLIPVACELGGKDAMIVLEDADLESAAHWGAWGAYFNTGQTCMSVERVYVVEPVYDEFVRRAVNQTLQLRAGYSNEIKNKFYIGPMTDPRQVKTIERHLEDARVKGARLLTGGRREGMFYEPMVLVDVDHSMLLMQEETFGPLMPIVKVKDEAEAIRLANDSNYGLGASIWSADLEHAQRVAHQVEASSVIINDTVAQFAVAMVPFGGIKHSGYGRTHGKEGLIQFTRPYSYVLGQPPLPFDVATLARKPGNYGLLAAILRLVFGVRPDQRLQPVVQPVKELLEAQPLPVQKRWGALGLAALGSFAALAGVVVASKKRK